MECSPASRGGDELVSNGRGELVPARSLRGGALESGASNESKRLASVAESHLPAVTILTSYGETTTGTTPDGGDERRRSTIKVVQIGDEQYRVRIPDVGKSDTLTADESRLSELEILLLVPGRRAEIIDLIRRVGEKI